MRNKNFIKYSSIPATQSNESVELDEGLGSGQASSSVIQNNECKAILETILFLKVSDSFIEFIRNNKKKIIDCMEKADISFFQSITSENLYVILSLLSFYFQINEDLFKKLIINNPKSNEVLRRIILTNKGFLSDMINSRENLELIANKLDNEPEFLIEIINKNEFRPLIPFISLETKIKLINFSLGRLKDRPYLYRKIISIFSDISDDEAASNILKNIIIEYICTEENNTSNYLCDLLKFLFETFDINEKDIIKIVQESIIFNNTGTYFIKNLDVLLENNIFINLLLNGNLNNFLKKIINIENNKLETCLDKFLSIPGFEINNSLINEIVFNNLKDIKNQVKSKTDSKSIPDILLASIDIIDKDKKNNKILEKIKFNNDEINAIRKDYLLSLLNNFIESDFKSENLFSKKIELASNSWEKNDNINNIYSNMTFSEVDYSFPNINKYSSTNQIIRTVEDVFNLLVEISSFEELFHICKNKKYLIDTLISNYINKSKIDIIVNNINLIKDTKLSIKYYLYILYKMNSYSNLSAITLIINKIKNEGTPQLNYDLENLPKVSNLFRLFIKNNKEIESLFKKEFNFLLYKRTYNNEVIKSFKGKSEQEEKEKIKNSTILMLQHKNILFDFNSFDKRAKILRNFLDYLLDKNDFFLIKNYDVIATCLASFTNANTLFYNFIEEKKISLDNLYDAILKKNFNILLDFSRSTKIGNSNEKNKILSLKQEKTGPIKQEEVVKFKKDFFAKIEELNNEVATISLNVDEYNKFFQCKLSDLQPGFEIKVSNENKDIAFNLSELNINNPNIKSIIEQLYVPGDKVVVKQRSINRGTYNFVKFDDDNKSLIVKSKFNDKESLYIYIDEIYFINKFLYKDGVVVNKGDEVAVNNDFLESFLFKNMSEFPNKQEVFYNILKNNEWVADKYPKYQIKFDTFNDNMIFIKLTILSNSFLLKENINNLERLEDRAEDLLIRSSQSLESLSKFNNKLTNLINVYHNSINYGIADKIIYHAIKNPKFSAEDTTSKEFLEIIIPFIDNVSESITKFSDKILDEKNINNIINLNQSQNQKIIEKINDINKDALNKINKNLINVEQFIQNKEKIDKIIVKFLKNEKLDFSYASGINEVIKQLNTDICIIEDYSAISNYIEYAKPKDERLYDFDLQLNQNINFKVIRFLDPYAFRIGADTGCCQRLGGAGESAAIDSFINPVASVLLCKINDDLISQSYFHYDSEGNNLILDNVEWRLSNINKYNLNNKMLSKIYYDYANKIKEKLNLNYVLCGGGNNMNQIDASYFKEANKEQLLRVEKRHFEVENLDPGKAHERYTDFKYGSSDLLRANEYINNINYNNAIENVININKQASQINNIKLLNKTAIRSLILNYKDYPAIPIALVRMIYLSQLYK